MRRFTTSALAGVVGVYGLAAQRLAQFLERARLRAAEEQAGIAVADDGVGVVLVERLELALRLQHETGGNLTASYRRHKLLKVGYLPNVRRLVYDIDYLAKQGIRFSQFKNTGRSCPSRAALLTGHYQHEAGMGWMTAVYKGLDFS